MPGPSLGVASAAVVQVSEDSLTADTGYTPDSDGAATESAGNDLTDLVLTSSCTTQFTYTGAGQLELVSSGQCVTASDALNDAMNIADDNRLDGPNLQS
ncbi:TPA: hypothetical protein ACH3X1_001124 [Trebouxia sp. C0004]